MKRSWIIYYDTGAVMVLTNYSEDEANRIATARNGGYVLAPITSQVVEIPARRPSPPRSVSRDNQPPETTWTPHNVD